MASTAFINTALTNYNSNLIAANNTWTGNNIFAYGQVPTTTSNLNGIGFAWNNIQGSGDTSIINYAGAGGGGFNFYVVSQTRMPDLLFNMNPNNAILYVPLTAQTPTQANNDNSTNLANTAFVSTALTNYNSSILAANNIFSGANTFNNILNSYLGTTTTQTSSDNSTKLASTAFTNTALSNYNSNLIAANNIFSGANTFNNSSNSFLGTTITQTSSDNST